MPKAEPLGGCLAGISRRPPPPAGRSLGRRLGGVGDVDRGTEVRADHRRAERAAAQTRPAGGLTRRPGAPEWVSSTTTPHSAGCTSTPLPIFVPLASDVARLAPVRGRPPVRQTADLPAPRAVGARRGGLPTLRQHRRQQRATGSAPLCGFDHSHQQQGVSEWGSTFSDDDWGRMSVKGWRDGLSMERQVVRKQDDVISAYLTEDTYAQLLFGIDGAKQGVLSDDRVANAIPSS